MHKLSGRLIALALGAMVIVSALSLNSCRERTTLEVDTVHDTIFVHDPDWDDSTGWAYRNSGTTSDLAISQFVNPSLGFVGGQNGTVLRTTDSGNTWSKLSPVAVSSESGNIVYGVHFFDASNGFATGDGYNIYRTTDGGATWNATALSTSSQNFRCLAFASPMVGVAGTADAYSSPPGMNGQLWRTSDGSATWKNVLGITTGSFYEIHFLSATNGIAAGKFGAVYVTTDGGIAWDSAHSDQPGSQITHMTFIDAMTGFAVAAPDSNHGYILKTVDGGRNWATVQTVPYQIQGIASNGTGTITAGGYYGNVLESTDNGVTWVHSMLGSDRWIDVNYPTSHRGILFGSKGHIIVRDK